MDDVLELWRAGGERIALAACRGTLRALARGRGGFYLPDDLLQDLFVDFWLLAQRTPRDALWTAWRQHLRRGGSRTLRRPRGGPGGPGGRDAPDRGARSARARGKRKRVNHQGTKDTKEEV